MDEPSTTPSDDPVAAVGIALRFDEVARVWEAYVPLLDVYDRDPVQEALVERTQATVRRMLADVVARPEINRFRAAMVWWDTALGICFGSSMGLSSAVALAGFLPDRWTLWGLGGAIAASLVGIGLATRAKRTVQRWEFREPHKIGEDGWPIVQDSTGAIR